MEKKDLKLSRWQRISVTDVMCVCYWIWVFITFLIFSNIREDFNTVLGFDSLPKKIIFVFLSWLITISIFQTILGQKGYLKAIVTWIFSPFIFLKIVLGFLWDTRATVNKLRRNFPIKRALLLSLPITYLVAFNFTHPILLKFSMYVIFFQLAFLIIWSFRWCIDPLKSFESLKYFKDQENKFKIVSGLVKSLGDKNLDFQKQIEKKVKQLIKLFMGLEYLSKKIGTVSFLFSCFLVMWGFVLVNVVIGSAGILRILHLTTEGGVFSGKLFLGKKMDFILVAALQFLGSDIHGIDVISRNVLLVLGFLPLASLVLLVVVITAFTMVAQSKFESAVLETHKEVGSLFDLALREIKKAYDNESGQESDTFITKDNLGNNDKVEVVSNLQQ